MIWILPKVGHMEKIPLRLRSAFETSTGLLDPSVVKSWLQECETRHKCYCIPPVPPTANSQLYLIDVNKRSVVAARGSPRYVALSYVWGDIEAPEHDSSAEYNFRESNIIKQRAGNRAAMSTIGSLPSQLPKTVEDAMNLVKQIGETFLWVDAYCIDQDPVERKRQIRQMDRIYEEALFTAVALSGSNANSGILGFNQPLDALPQPTMDIKTALITATKRPLIAASIHDSPWNERAWTMQEALLSKRRLFLADGQIFLWCREDIFHNIADEGFRNWIGHHPRVTAASGIMKFLVTQIWDDKFSRIDLEHLVEAYTGRQLSFSSDALNAFTGIQNRIERNENAPFFYGIAVQDLPESLLWETQSSGTVSRRPHFPSWSWLGWECQIQFSSIRRQRSVLRGVHYRNLDGTNQDMSLDPFITRRIEATVPNDRTTQNATLSVRTEIAHFNLVQPKYATHHDERLCLADFQGRRLAQPAVKEDDLAERTGCCFCTNESLNEELVQRSSETVECLLIVQWKSAAELHPFFEEAAWLESYNDSVWAWVILRNPDNTARRVAFVRIRSDAWEAASPQLMRVDLV